MPITIRKFRVGSEQIENDAIGSSVMVADDVIGGDQVIDNSLGYGELTSGLQGTIAAGSIPPADSIGTTELKEPAVGSSQLYNDAIGSSIYVGDDVIGPDQLMDDAVGSSAHVADNVIHDEHIVGSAITANKMAANAIGSSEIIADSVIHDEHIVGSNITANKMAGDAIGSSEIVADNVIGNDQMMDAAIGYTELTSGLQGSLGVIPSEKPYAGDDSIMSNYGTAPGTVKTASILKHADALPIGTIKIGATLKASAGTYTMRVNFDGSNLLSFAGTLTDYKVHVGTFGIGGYADGVHTLNFVIENSRTNATTYNQLVDIIAVL